MSKILAVAVREYASTVMTKGFIIGAMVLPAVIGVVLIALLLLFATSRPDKVEGEIAIIDRSGAVGSELAERLSPERIAERQAERARRAQRAIGALTGQSNIPFAEQVAGRIEAPDLTVTILDPAADVDAEKDIIVEGNTPGGRDEVARGGSDGGPGGGDGGVDGLGVGGRIVLIVIDEHAVVQHPLDPDAAQDHASQNDAQNGAVEGDTIVGGASGFGGFEMYVRPRLDADVEGLLRDVTRESIRDTRIRAAGLEPEMVDALTRVRSAETVEVSEDGERASRSVIRTGVGYGFMMLVMMSVFIGGQYLLTTVVEEKSSRVVEVLLSALSPIQLMTGKIVGQLLVGLTIMLVYGVLGGGVLTLFALSDLLGVAIVLWMIVFFLIAYFMVASLLAAVGSAVNDMREAQSLQTPVMMVLVIPYALGIPIARDPNSTFAVVCSYLPPINPFVMMLRMTSNDPPPMWEVLLSALVGVIGCVVCVFVAAKIFRVGLLMFGKPPSFGTLIKWIRMS